MERGNPIKQYLELSGLSYEAAAKKTGLSKQAIWMHATGRMRLSAKAFFTYNKAFGLSFDKLAEISNNFKEVEDG